MLESVAIEEAVVSCKGLVVTGYVSFESKHFNALLEH